MEWEDNPQNRENASEKETKAERCQGTQNNQRTECGADHGVNRCVFASLLDEVQCSDLKGYGSID